MDFQYSNHDVAFVPLHNTENKLKICSGLRQHEQNQAAFRTEFSKTPLHSAMFNFSTKHHLLFISRLKYLSFKENHVCLL